MYHKRQKWIFPLLFNNSNRYRLNSIIICMHFFILPNLVNAQKAPSSRRFSGLECSPPGIITIEFFVGKEKRKKVDLKVVIGRDFAYKGLNSNTGAWIWSIGGTKKWNATFTPKNPGTTENEGKGIIPLTEMPASNSDFGLNRGKEEVSNALSEKGDVDVEVFFLKNDDKNNPAKVPNWFYYWKQILPDKQYTLPVFNINNPVQPTNLSIPIDFLYSDKGKYAWNPGAGFAFGNTNISPNLIPIDFSNPNGPRYADSYIIEMTLGEGTAKICGHELEENLSTSEIKVVSETGSDGISCFYQVYIHEMYHVEIWKDNYPLGYRNDQDSDKDGYSDDFEIRHAVEGFINGNDNSYKNGKGSVGYDYEERLCRAIEDASNSSILDPFDWSFETNDNKTKGRPQGKNWKK